MPGRTTVAPAPEGTGATVSISRAERFLLQDAQVGTVQLVAVDGPGREPVRTLEPGQVADVQLRPRHVGRVSGGRVGQHERLREVGVRTVDQRNVTMAHGVRTAR